HQLAPVSWYATRAAIPKAMCSRRRSHVMSFYLFGSPTDPDGVRGSGFPPVRAAISRFVHDFRRRERRELVALQTRPDAYSADVPAARLRSFPAWLTDHCPLRPEAAAPPHR